MTTGRINQVTIFGGGDGRAPERTGRPQAPLGRGRSSFGSDRVRSRVRPRGRVVGPGREPAASNVTPIHFPQLNSPGQGPPKDGSPPRRGRVPDFGMPAPRGGYPRSVTCVAARLPTIGHAPQYVANSTGHWPTIHRPPRRQLRDQIGNWASELGRRPKGHSEVTAMRRRRRTARGRYPRPA